MSDILTPPFAPPPKPAGAEQVLPEITVTPQFDYVNPYGVFETGIAGISPKIIVAGAFAVMALIVVFGNKRG